MARATNIVLNVMSLVLVVAGLALAGTFFFTSASPETVASATSQPDSSASGPDGLDVPVITESEQSVDPDEREVAEEDVISPVPDDKGLRLTVPGMSRVQDVEIPYAAGNDEESLREHSAIHLAGTGFPWEREANVYVAGHRLGYPNTGSFLAFFDLNNLENGDEVVLTDAEDRDYTYRVFNSEIVEPTDTDVTEPVEGRNIVTLQTCTLPDYSQRLIIQAERVD
ncbi:MAG: class E sortase [Actinomycetota bacterium]|jgi:sortase A|nr:class E sortase [Actinomycetota bacterium]